MFSNGVVQLLDVQDNKVFISMGGGCHGVVYLSFPEARAPAVWLRGSFLQALL